MCSLTYNQTMPAFLDFMFPFGDQEYAQDFHFGGFKYDLRLNQLNQCHPIPELGRSSQGFQMCYSLKSVESSQSDAGWPWSIRHTAVNHSFDTDTGRTAWTIVKGSKLMKNRITRATAPGRGTNFKRFETPEASLRSSIEVQMIICDWSRENWRWYINFLEDRVQALTNKTLHATVGRSPTPVPKPKHAHTTPPMVKRQSTLTNAAVTAINRVKQTVSWKIEKKSTPTTAIPMISNTPKEKDPVVLESEDFSFSDLQEIQYVEEKANETVLVLKMNSEIVSDLRKFYSDLIDSDDCKRTMRERCKANVANLEQYVRGILSDLKMQQDRLEMLQKILSERKQLVRCNFDDTWHPLNLADVRHTRVQECTSQQCPRAESSALRGEDGENDREDARDSDQDRTRDSVYAHYYNRDTDLPTWNFYIGKHHLPIEAMQQY